MFNRNTVVAGILVAGAAITMALVLAGSASASTAIATAPQSAPAAHSAHAQAPEFEIRPVADVPPGIQVPNIPVVINNSHQALVITTLTVDRGLETAYWVGPGPADGLVIPAGSGLYVTWVERFDSEIDLTYQSTDGSTVATSTGFRTFGGWGYGCNNATGTLRCDDNGTNPSSWDQNVAIDNA